MTEREILNTLRAAYPPPAWAFLEHVADGTGANRLRTSDAMAMSLWPSRGLTLQGFEVKSYRGDWLRELKDPSKADEMVGRCHHWWVVAGDESVVRVEEVPQTWGLLVGPNLTIAREAPVLTPAPLDYPFLAAVLRRAAQAFVAGGGVEARARAQIAKERDARGDPAKVRARLERLAATAARISQDVRSAVWQLDKEPQP